MASARQAGTKRNDTLTALRGVLVGQAERPEEHTGCTVFVFKKKAIAAVDVRGAAPGTLDTEILGPTRTFHERSALFFAGGSQDGLDIGSGIRRALRERGIGWRVGERLLVPLSGAIVFDIGALRGAPSSELAYEAAAKASSATVREGNVGAGMGATVGKFSGLRYAMKGGVGSCVMGLPSGLLVGACVVTNAVGNVVDPGTGETVAGARNPLEGAEGTKGKGILSWDQHVRGLMRKTSVQGGSEPLSGTCLGVVATNAYLEHAQLAHVASMAQDGFARTVYPAHGARDGDVVFAVSVGELRKFLPRPKSEDWPGLEVDIVGSLAAEAVARSVLRSVRKAKSIRWKDALDGVIPACR